MVKEIDLLVLHQHRGKCYKPYFADLYCHNRYGKFQLYFADFYCLWFW